MSEGTPFEINSRLSVQTVIKTIERQRGYETYALHRGKTIGPVGCYVTEQHALAGHSRWVKGPPIVDRSCDRVLRVLVAEDNPDDVFIVSRVFEKFVSWDIMTVFDGLEALDLLNRRSDHVQHWLPDLFLLSINMPKINGYEVLETIQSDSILAKIPVVMWSVSCREESYLRAHRLGAFSYHPKLAKTRKETECLTFIRDYFECKV